MDAIKSIDQYAPIVPENHSDIEDLNESRPKTNVGYLPRWRRKDIREYAV